MLNDAAAIRAQLNVFQTKASIQLCIEFQMSRKTQVLIFVLFCIGQRSAQREMVGACENQTQKINYKDLIHF